MSTEEVLSDDEKEALREGVDSGAVDTEGETGNAGARIYDFASEERVVRGRMPTLENINERFARAFRVSMFNMLRRNVEVSVNGLAMYKYSDYINTLSVPTSLNFIKMAPLRNNALFVLDEKLVYSLVNNFFGGDGRSRVKTESRGFTPTETRIVGKYLELVFRDLQEAWEPVLEIDCNYENTEMNPLLANFVSATEVVVINQFHIELESGGGDFHIAFPYSMLEPIKELLDINVRSDGHENDARWVTSLQHELMYVPVEISSKLPDKEISLGEILRLKEGDVVPIDTPDLVTVFADTVPSFEAKFGESQGYMALKIMSRIEH